MRGEWVFYYSLAEILGYASVNRMLAEMSSKEVSRWIAYFNLKQRQEQEESERQSLQAQAEQMRRQAT